MTAGISNALLTQGLQRFLTAIAGGQLIAYSAPRPAKGILFGAFVELARFQLPNPAGVIASGQLVLSPVPTARGVAQGVPTWCRWIGSDSSFVLDCDVPADIAFTYGVHARIEVGSTVTLAGVQVGAATFNAAQFAITEANAIAAFTAVGSRDPVSNPSITQINLVVGGQPYDMRNLFTDPDGDTMTYTVVGGGSQLGGFSTLNGAAGFLNPVAAGTVNVQFTADDGNTVVVPPLTGISYLGAIQLPVDPTDGVTQLKIGPRAAGVSVGPDGLGKLYMIGGEWQQAATGIGMQPGSNTLFSFDPYNNWAAAVVSPYYITTANPAVLQPQYPDGVGLVYNQNITGTAVVVVPGRNLPTNQFGVWPAGKATPSTHKLAWVISAFASPRWVDYGVSAVGSPSPWPANALKPTSGFIASHAVVGVGAACKVITNDTSGGNNFVEPCNTGPYTIVADPSLFNQWWDFVEEGTTQRPVRGGCIYCFEWSTGNILMVLEKEGTHQWKCEVKATIPALTASTDPFILSWDGLRRKLVAFYRTHIYVINCDDGAVFDAGPMPVTTTGFRVGFYECESDSHILTGEDAGSDKFYRFRLPLYPITPIPVDSWYEAQVDGLYFARSGLVWKWPDQHGSWWDANGVAQGTAVFASVAASALGLYQLNILALYQKWVAIGVNTGILIRNDGSDSSFGGRLNTDLTKRPTLTVVSSTGTFTCICTETCMAQGLTSGPQGALAQFRPNGDSGLLRFDITAVTGVVSSVTLNLWCTARSGAVGTLKVYRPRTTKIVDQDEVGAVIPGGFAALYNNDGAHKTTGAPMKDRPGVLVVSDFSPGWQARMKVPVDSAVSFSQAPGLPPGTIAFDPLFNSYALRAKIAAYTVGGPGTYFTFSNYGVPDQEEFNIRFQVLWEQDYVPQISGVKGLIQSWFPMTNPYTEGGAAITGLMMPRDAGSDNSQEPQQYRIDLATNRIVLYPVAGAPSNRFQDPYSNTVLPPDGTAMQFIFLTPPPGITERTIYYVRNATVVSGVPSFQISTTPTGALFVFSGPQPNYDPAVAWWRVGQNRSCVVLCDSTPNSAISHGMNIKLCGGMDFMETNHNIGMPKDKNRGLITFFTYNYDPVEMGGGGYPESLIWGDKDTQYSTAKREKVYSLEVHQRMNTVSGPFDSFGNGQGNADGLTEYFFNGHLAHAHTDRLFRHHPSIKFQWVRCLQYHGGTSGTQSCFHTRYSDFVFTAGPNMYIGPKG